MNFLSEYRHVGLICIRRFKLRVSYIATDSLYFCKYMKMLVSIYYEVMFKSGFTQNSE
jgi:hypothetical protein